MRKVTVFALLFVFVLGVTAVFAIGIPGAGGGGPALKVEEKTLKLSDLNANFKKFEGTDLDTLKAGYKYNVYGDAEIDTFMTSSHKIKATMGFANVLVTDLDKKVDAAKDKNELDAVKGDADVLSTVLTGVTADSTKLAATGTSLSTSAPNKFKGNPMNLKVLPSLTKDLGTCLDCLKSAGADAKTLSDKLIPLMDKIKAKALTFAK